ncbi:MAG: hypothetical protein JNM09_17735 [Blastocatellia bacterium]|nr:hypothetical protein [Blastocatellia bacterium]
MAMAIASNRAYLVRIACTRKTYAADSSGKTFVAVRKNGMAAMPRSFARRSMA